MDKLNFLTAGIPIVAKDFGYKEAFKTFADMGLDGMEIEFVHGVKIGEENAKIVRENVQNNGFKITAHAPYYINLNSLEKDKLLASIERIKTTAQVSAELGAVSIVYHAAYYMKKSPEDVYQTVFNAHKNIVKFLEDKNINIYIRPETTGKATQWGNLEEIVRLSKEFKQVLPCVDFSHLHARYNGTHNTYDEFAKILEHIAENLGSEAIENFHGHIAGIAYTPKGERNHLNLLESDMNYKDLLKALKNFNVKGTIVCESPNIETDCKMLKDYYLSL